jgi:hypothetical protein
MMAFVLFSVLLLFQFLLFFLSFLPLPLSFVPGFCHSNLPFPAHTAKTHPFCPLSNSELVINRRPCAPYLHSVMPTDKLSSIFNFKCHFYTHHPTGIPRSPSAEKSRLAAQMTDRPGNISVDTLGCLEGTDIPYNLPAAGRRKPDPGRRSLLIFL